MLKQTHTVLTDLLSPASTKNCPWGLQKMLLACCLSNISVEKGQCVTFSGLCNSSFNTRVKTSVESTHLWARSCRCFSHDRRRRWFWEPLRGERQTCCRWAPTQMLWCPLERQTQTICKALVFLRGMISATLCLFHILTLHLHHINRNLLLSHAEDFKVGDHTLKKIDKHIKPLIFTGKNLAVCPLVFFRSKHLPVFPSESCPLSRTGNLHFAASAVCSRQHWRGCGHGSPVGKASASESLWLGCLCPQEPRMLWCCHLETMRSPCRYKTQILINFPEELPQFKACNYKKRYHKSKDSYLIPLILRLFLSSRPMDWKEQKRRFIVTFTLRINTTIYIDIFEVCLLESHRCSECLWSSWQRTFHHGSTCCSQMSHDNIVREWNSSRCEKQVEETEKDKEAQEYWLEYGPVCRALAVEASLLLSSQNVPDDDGLWVLLGVHQRTEGHHIPGKHPNHTWSFRQLRDSPVQNDPFSSIC